MSNINETLSNSQDDGEIEFFERVILEPRCRLPSVLDDLFVVRERFGLDDDVTIGLLDESEWADSFREGWVCFYEYPFKIGHIFPFNKLTADFINLNPVPICQYMPSVWRLLRAIELLLEKHEHLQFEACELGHVYTLSSDGPGRITLVQRTGKAVLVTHLSKANDRGWMQRYVFVKKSDLGGFGSGLCEDWITDCSTLYLAEGEHSVERVQAILEIPEAERSYSNLTKPEDSPTTLPTKCFRGPGTQDRSVRRTRATVPHAPSKASSSSIPFVISDYDTMSSGSQNTGGSTPSASDVLQRLRNKQAGGHKPPSPVPIRVVPPSSTTAAGVKRKNTSAPDPQFQQNSTLQLSFSADFGISKPNSPPMVLYSIQHDFLSPNSP